MHRLPLLHLGLPLGRAHRGMGLSRSQDRKVHPLRGPRDQPVPLTRNGKAPTGTESKKFRVDIVEPACVKACPADALLFGNRDDILK